MAEGVLRDSESARPFLQHTPLRRVGSPEEVADVVLWLLSHDARFVTGQSLLVDGGFTLVFRFRNSNQNGSAAWNFGNDQNTRFYNNLVVLDVFEIPKIAGSNFIGISKTHH